eukprot:TRINITY_DN2379_c0_g1_i1.p1 TRINITY_DN2379_c0_g1~~TRINITY_DN2379_c0_g1_i1.p1  ORF type:complete len:162 (-),score=34.96 TRINITY_DN2379_c0_g1_i1:373-858(-)
MCIRDRSQRLPALAVCALSLLAFATASPRVEFTVSLSPGKQGLFVMEVRPDWAPLGAARFLEMVESDYFKGQRFFRVIDSFIAQFGIHGDPSKALPTIKDDPSEEWSSHQTGMVAFSTRVSSTGQTYGPMTGAASLSADKMHYLAMAKMVGLSSVTDVYQP